jgi:serine/threonine protein kinase/Tol biopolymer transport system component
MLGTGTSLGTYEILSAIGAGGMGEVYRARDTRLGRDVAIKILPSAFTADTERLTRFEREARLLASLNHPHIAQIYGLEPSPSPFIVMELVDGGTLADRIRSGPIPMTESMAIARQIIDGLDAAHERGIVHRDLKPANIAFTSAGEVKILDFGLAKQGTEDVAQGFGPADLTHSPTMMTPTLDGMLLGTAPYMSPEQARGRPIDKRADIWAFGCVWFEMLTGRRAFDGETTTDVVARIVEREPDWTKLPASAPAALVRLIKHCIEKDPKKRLRDIGEARHALDQMTSDVPTTSPRSSWIWPTIATATAVAGAAVAWTAGAFGRGAAPTAEPREPSTFAIEASLAPGSPAGLPAPGIAVSRDGRSIAWTAEGAGGRLVVWLYSISTGETRSLSGTEGAANPFWSPDGRSLAFSAQASLKIVDLATGLVRVLATLPEVSAGGTWNDQNVIVFAARYAIDAIPASGGDRRVVAELNRDRQENSLRYPRFLPDGRHFLYVARSGRTGQSSAYLGSLDGKAVWLFPTTSHVEYAPPGYLVYAKDGVLVARTFDVRSFAIGQETLTIASPVGANAGGMNGHFDVSPAGVLAFYKHSTSDRALLRWVDRSGQSLAAVTEPAGYSNFRIAPDNVHVAVDLESDRAVGRDVWVLNPAGAAPTRVTFGGSDDWQPIWSPDGQKVAFMSYRNGVGDLYVKTVNGTAPEEPLLTSADQKIPGDWSRDGRFVALWSERADTRGDIAVVAVQSKQITWIARTQANERRPRFSPDARFVAYESDESGTNEVYVQPFPPTGGKWQISVGGGNEVAWRGDGRELYYVNVEGALLAVPVALSANGFSAGVPSTLFDVGRRGGSAGTGRYDVTTDGRRFLVRQVAQPPRQPLMVMLNWSAALKK